MTDIRYHSFVCPRCDGRDWGTDNAGKPFAQWVGRCHGCHFTWPRSDDPKYWKPVEEDWDELEEDEAC